MALDPRIAMSGGTVPDLLSAVSGGLNLGSRIRNQPLFEALQRQNLEDAQARSQENARQQKMQQMMILGRVAEQVRALPEDQRGLFVQQNAPQLQAIGINPAGVGDLSDASLDRFISTNRAIFPRAAPAPIKVSETERLIDPRTGQVLVEPSTTVNERDIRKEVRSSVGQQIKDIKSQASTIKSNFAKLENLSGEISKGNRTAVAQGLVALVKLGDPSSIVSEREAAAALNNPNPVAAFVGMLQGKGVKDDVVQSVAARIDPLNPDNVNVNDLLSTASSLVQANVPVLQDRFAAERLRADENLSPAGIKSLFDANTESLVQGLSDLRPTPQPASFEGFRIISVE